jgi:hypothetical protein
LSDRFFSGYEACLTVRVSSTISGIWLTAMNANLNPISQIWLDLNEALNNSTIFGDKRRVLDLGRLSSLSSVATKKVMEVMVPH